MTFGVSCCDGRVARDGLGTGGIVVIRRSEGSVFLRISLRDSGDDRHRDVLVIISSFTLSGNVMFWFLLFGQRRRRFRQLRSSVRDSLF